jgi:hypothetical protein
MDYENKLDLLCNDLGQDMMEWLARMMDAGIPNLVLPIRSGEDDENPGEMVACAVITTGALAQEIHDFMYDLQQKYQHSTGTIQ